MKCFEIGKENREIILFLHGGGLSWWNYREVSRHLSGRFHVVMPILDGHAGSDAPFTSMEENAKRIIALIDERFGGQVLLIGGLSLGAQVLVEMLSQRPDICRYAVIESALAVPMKWTAALVGPSFSLCYPLIQKRWFAKLQFAYLGIKPDLFEDYYRDTAQIAKSDLIAWMRANSSYTLKAAMEDCRAKALVFVGSRELPVMRRSARLIAESIEGAQLEILKGYQHGELSINRGEQYAQRILQFIGKE